jgi:hypothetical protein
VGAKFVHTDREISPAIQAATVEALRAAFVPGANEDFETLAYRTLRGSDLRGGALVAVVDVDGFPGFEAVVVEGAASSIVRATVEQAPGAVADVIDAEIVESVPVEIVDEVTVAVVIDASTVDAVARVGAWWDAVRALPAGEAVAA